jgi:hypothetical protein
MEMHCLRILVMENLLMSRINLKSGIMAERRVRPHGRTSIMIENRMDRHIEQDHLGANLILG